MIRVLIFCYSEMRKNELGFDVKKEKKIRKFPQFFSFKKRIFSFLLFCSTIFSFLLHPSKWFPILPFLFFFLAEKRFFPFSSVFLRSHKCIKSKNKPIVTLNKMCFSFPSILVKTFPKIISNIKKKKISIFVIFLVIKRKIVEI